MNNNPLTVKEFKSILNHYDMNERDRLTAWYKQASETIEKTSSIDTIDFTPFLMDGVIHEGGHNTVDFENNSNFKTINSLLNGRATGATIDPSILSVIRNNIKKILTAQLNKLALLENFNDIFNINETFIANLIYYGTALNGYICYLLNNNYNFNKVLKSFATLDILRNGRDRGVEPPSGIDINTLFYISNDVSIGGTPASRGLEAPTLNIPNHFIHAHICLGGSQLFIDMINEVNVLTDEYIDNLPFISYVEVSEIKKKPETIDITNDLPYPLSANQITAINEHNVEITKGLYSIKPIAYYDIDGDVHNVYGGGILFINDEGKLGRINIEENQITNIAISQTT